jgi:hypothetical protein
MESIALRLAWFHSRIDGRAQGIHLEFASGCAQ